MKVLIADDEPIARHLAAHTLQQAGYEVITSTDGKSALDMLPSSGARIVVSDWNMPLLCGPDFCRQVRADSHGAYVYLILLTSRNSSEDIVSGLAAGADDYVIKPFNPQELIMRVNTGRRIVGLETRDLTIFSLAKLAESRDPETGSHLERVRVYCRLLALQLRALPKYAQIIDDEYVRLIFETSSLHDIGKVGIPDAILLKPGKLTPEEFEIMKTHTTKGADTLKAAMEQYPDAAFLRMGYDIAYCHHERFDGSGYPRGLQYEAIPLSARIVTVADVYDALTSKRVYKDAFAHHLARDIIVRQNGRQFDPDVVDAFLKCQEEFISSSLQFSDMKATTLNTNSAL
jgi:putative two-component system response regulator